MDIQGSADAIASMNPCANSFAPKPTYADTLKASLPQKQHPDEKRRRKSHRGKKGPNIKLRGVTGDESKQVGFSVHHDRESEPSSAPETLDGMRESLPETDHGFSRQLPNPLIWRPHSRATPFPEAVMANPRLQHLHPQHMTSSPPSPLLAPNHIRQGNKTIGSPPIAYRDSESETPAEWEHDALPHPENTPTSLPFPPFGSGYDNLVFPLPFHYALPPMLPPNPQQDPASNWIGGRQGSACEAQMPFFLPPAPYPFSPISTPVPFHHPFAHGHPQPIVPPPGPLMYGPGPHISFPIHTHGRLQPQPSDRPKSARGRSSRSISQRNRKRSRRAFAELEDPEEVVGVKPAESLGRTEGLSRAAADTLEKAPAQRGRSMDSALRVKEASVLDALGEHSLPTVIQPERGRAKYRLISPTTNHIHSGRSDQSRIGINACREGSECVVGSALRLPTPGPSAEHYNTLSEQLSDISTVATPEPPISLRGEPPKEPRNSRLLSGGPPLNAPTAPASQRRLVTTSQGKTQTSLTHNSSETGSWSQSKRWISQETKERTLFQKLMHNLHYMGADQSPFIPKTPATLAAFRLAENEAKSRALTRQLQTKVESLTKRKKEEAEGCRNTILTKTELFLGKEMPDGLSPVFASNTCFRKTIPTDKTTRPQWPSLAELKEEGDKRAARYGRFFPLPRVNQICKRVAVAGDGELYNSDGTISWEKKQVKLDGRFVQPVTPEEEGPVELTAHIDILEVHRSLQSLMHEIDGIDADDTYEYNEVENMVANNSSKQSADHR